MTTEYVDDDLNEFDNDNGIDFIYNPDERNIFVNPGSNLFYNYTNCHASNHYKATGNYTHNMPIINHQSRNDIKINELHESAPMMTLSAR